MISAATIAALEERGLEYVLGARERSTASCAVSCWRRAALHAAARRSRAGRDPALRQGGQARAARYIVCRNEAEAERSAERQAIVAALNSS